MQIVLGILGGSVGAALFSAWFNLRMDAKRWARQQAENRVKIDVENQLWIREEYRSALTDLSSLCLPYARALKSIASGESSRRKTAMDEFVKLDTEADRRIARFYLAMPPTSEFNKALDELVLARLNAQEVIQSPTRFRKHSLEHLESLGSDFIIGVRNLEHISLQYLHGTPEVRF